MATDDAIPGETSVMTWIEIVAADEELWPHGGPKTYTLTLRVLDSDGKCVGEESRELHPAKNVGRLPTGVQSFSAGYFGGYTLEATLGDASTSLKFTLVGG